MVTFTRFEDIDAWRQTRSLCAETYRMSGNRLFEKDFGLRDQMRRASTSIIAEGFERNGTREFIHFLAIAKGSAGEMRSQLYIALDQGYLNREEFSRLSQVASDTAKMIGALMRYLSTTGIKGSSTKAFQHETRNSTLETRIHRSSRWIRPHPPDARSPVPA